MSDALRLFARHLGAPGDNARAIDWSQIRFSHLASFRESCVGQSAATIRGKLAAVKGVLKCTWREGNLSAEELARACDVRAPKGKAIPKGRALTQAEIQQLFAGCAGDDSLAGFRDGAIFALFRTGMRVGELVGLDTDDYRPNGDGTATVLIRREKGGGQRLAYLSGSALGWVEKWLEVRGPKPGPIVCDVRLGRANAERRIGITAVEAMCQRRAESAGVLRFTPHDFRRTVATQLKDKGVDIADIRDFLGHANIQTTAAYFRNDKEESKRQAALALETPGGDE